MMTVKEILKEYLKEGYKLVKPVSTDQENKTHVILRKGEKTVLVTVDDEEDIRYIEETFEELYETVGTQITVICEIRGTNIVKTGVFEFNEFIEGLNKNTSWEIESIDGHSTFGINCEIESIDKEKIKEQIDKLEKFVDFLAFTQGIGIVINNIGESEIRINRDDGQREPILTRVQDQKRLKKSSKEQIEKILDVIDTSEKKELFTAVHGLNHACAESHLPSRLSMLWTTTETIFRENPKHLLSAEEIEEICELITQSGILNSPKGEIKLKKLIDGIKDSNRFPAITRNESIASNISEQLDLDYDETLQNIKKAATKRGKHLHELRDDVAEIEKAEIFLQNVLIEYTKRQIPDIDEIL